MTPQIIPNHFNESDLTTLEGHLAALRYNLAPSWLGGFGFRMYGGAYQKKVPLPLELGYFKGKLAKLAPDQTFNTTFCQRYVVGQRVNSHRDPKNNLQKTLLLILGTFTGADTTCEDATFHLNRGDVLIQDCTIGGKQGPVHSVSPVLSGTRYAFILNTIVTK